jgi:VCBS repeat-containing protein
MAGGDIDGYTLEESQKAILAACVGVLAGAATSTVTIEAADGSKTRITGTVDADGNRSAVVLDVTG